MSPPLAQIVVVLVRTQGPVNLGLCARACANVGVGELRLVSPLCEVDCGDARKFANHARDAMLAAPVFPDLRSAVADCGLVIGTSGRDRDLDHHGAPLSPEQVPALIRERPAARCAVVFGNEADGLDGDELRQCNAWLRLDAPGSYPSYNLSHAVAITTYTMHAGLSAAPPAPVLEPGNEPATRERVEALADAWLASLEHINYFRRTTRGRWEPRFREMLARWRLSAHDCDVVRGMIAQVDYVAAASAAHEAERPQG